MSNSMRVFCLLLGAVMSAVWTIPHTPDLGSDCALVFTIVGALGLSLMPYRDEKEP